ncbi:hypothetical protein BDZ94DRAFT_1270222 [Collybia nuda]|uniref:Uncharacterized protein n=1 Tax=Collybia nuda TaxID=64659 RepID=A0A9P5XXN0_9AGAR|nr:hypothetical protein BDZ94DRAFT_1270222 [Collybia nuda]
MEYSIGSGPSLLSSLHLQGDNVPTDARHLQLNSAEDELHKLDVDLALILAKRSRLMKQINKYRSLPSIPWEQLTSLDLEGLLSFNDVCDILAQCKLLEDCKLQTVDRHSPGFVQSSGDLSRLKSLKIRLASYPLFNNLYLLSIPYLNTLNINIPPGESEDFTKFAAWMDVLGKTLRHVTIIRGNSTFLSTETQITLIIYLVPSVTHFITKECEMTLGMLRMIGSGELLPHLKVLEFLAPHGDRIEDMVDALIPMGPDRESPLREIFIHTHQRYCSGRRFQDLRDAGINIWAVYRYPHVVGTGPGGAVGTWTLV